MLQTTSLVIEGVASTSKKRHKEICNNILPMIFALEDARKGNNKNKCNHRRLISKEY